MNKRIFVFFFSLLVLILATTCAAQQGSGQWIYDAVAYLKQLEFGDLFADVHPENRYQVSLAIANTIQRLELTNNTRVQRFGVSRRVSLKELFDTYNLGVPEQKRLPEQALSILTQLADEHRDELNVLGYWIEDLPSNTVSLNQDLGKQPVILESNLFGSDMLTKLLKQKQDSIIKETDNGVNKSSVLSKYFGEDEAEDNRILINSLIPLWSSDLFIGAGLSLPAPSEPDKDTEDQPGYAGIIGEYLINQGLVLEGQYLHNLSQPFDPGVLQFGARGRLGNVTLRGLIQTAEDENEGAKASLDITYTTANSIMIRAGWDANLKPVSELRFPASTSIDVDIPISQGRIALGLVQKWNQEGTDEETSEFTDRTRASIEFSYDLTNEVSFKLDYRLIDFSDVNKALAEFSIRF